MQLNIEAATAGPYPDGSYLPAVRVTLGEELPTLHVREGFGTFPTDNEARAVACAFLSYAKELTFEGLREIKYEQVPLYPLS